jgi:flagellar basal-body rod modification protein FlgD
MSVSSTQNIADNRERFARHFQSKDNDLLSTDNFFNLLMAEMSNQDPLEPKSNTEFISQMANFTAMRVQQDALYYQNANYAQSLVGKSVTVAGMNAGTFRTESGIVTSMTLADGKFGVRVNGRSYQLSSIMEVLPTENPYTVRGHDGAYATSLIGKQVTIVGTSNTGARITETGVVQRIEIRDNEISVIVDNLSYPLDTVIRVEEPAPEPGAATAIATSDWAYATSLIGKFVTVTEPHEDGKGYVDTGVVTQVEVFDNRIKLIIYGVPYPLEYVTRVQDVNNQS